jgi:hypothetical protein
VYRSEWRNQNQLDHPTISGRIWKEMVEARDSNFNSLAVSSK